MSGKHLIMLVSSSYVQETLTLGTGAEITNPVHLLLNSLHLQCVSNQHVVRVTRRLLCSET